MDQMFTMLQQLKASTEDLAQWLEVVETNRPSRVEVVMTSPSGSPRREESPARGGRKRIIDDVESEAVLPSLEETLHEEDFEDFDCFVIS